VAAVNGDDERELASAYGIKGFPTIKLFPSQLTKTPDGKGFHKVPEDYEGPRTAAAMANFAVGKLPNFVSKITSKSIDSFLSTPENLAKVILFTNKKETSNLYKALAVDFHHQLVLGEVKDSEKEIVDNFGVTKFPTLIVQTVSGEKIPFTGELKHDVLYSFLKPHAKEIAGKSKGNQSGEKKKEAAPVTPQRPVKDEVTDQQTFESVCFNTNANCLIALLDSQNTEPEEHQKHIKVLEKVQEKYGKTFNMIWVDAVKQTEFVNLWNLASDYPSLVTFSHKKSSIVPYLGAFSDTSIGEYLEKILSGSKRASSVSKIPTIGNQSKDEL